MLYLENTDERRIIETLYEKFTEDLIVSDLAKYGVIVLPTPVLVDCAANACNQLSLPANPNTIETICREENIIKGVGELNRGENAIAIYRNGRQFTNAAFYKGDGLYSSVWDYLFPVLHPLNKVPYSFGNAVEFFKIDDCVRAEVINMVNGIDNSY